MRVWTASYLPFGSVHTSTGSNIDLRFPGQWFQSKSRLHQNWMRDYDPTTGRYIQADPLGLVDGASIYGYALQNPGRYVDPRGELITDINKALVCLALGICRSTPKTCGPGADSFDPDNPNTLTPPSPSEIDGTCSKCDGNIVENKSFPPGYLPGDAGAKEWGRRNGIGAAEGKRKFHKLKGQNKGSGASENMGVDPETGDVVDGNGESIGNLNDED